MQKAREQIVDIDFVQELPSVQTRIRQAIREGEVQTKEEAEKLLDGFIGEKFYGISYKITDDAWKMLTGG